MLQVKQVEEPLQVTHLGIGTPHKSQVAPDVR